ncbi:DUF4381 domain-containing protein [Gilvimarinus japonicus]|jgi:hypothetical protein|uniref:DUF4381 domain-containing protein n=1 Tax=Gilvimarinus japonicus TaxID=1796469 RepID=A0ABV7HXV0_9GAMM
MESQEELQKLELYQLYDRMEPLVAASPVAKIPEGPGWWVLLALILGIVAIAIGWKFYRRYQNRYRYYAITEINSLPEDFSPWQVSAILKRCALTEFPRQQVASLTGSHWTEFLNRHYPSGPDLPDFNQLQKGNPEKEGFDRLQLKQQAIDWLTGFKVAL